MGGPILGAIAVKATIGAALVVSGVALGPILPLCVREVRRAGTPAGKEAAGG